MTTSVRSPSRMAALTLHPTQRIPFTQLFCPLLAYPFHSAQRSWVEIFKGNFTETLKENKRKYKSTEAEEIKGQILASVIGASGPLPLGGLSSLGAHRLPTLCPVIKPLAQAAHLRESLGADPLLRVRFSVNFEGGSCLFGGASALRWHQPWLCQLP